ncbi:bifunctional DNA-formamidopyrimidine glycosylase/DNA-(apurinic or apyrimidinic site) lyase [Streptomyces sp. NPDC002067]
MPELPEVEVVRRGLERWVSGRTIDTVEVLHPRSIRRHTAGAADFAARLTGLRIEAARRRGKYLWLPVSGGGPAAQSAAEGLAPQVTTDVTHGLAVLAHLGMSGQLLVQPQDAPDEKHLRIRIRFDDTVSPPPADAAGTELRFVDQRTFGGLSLHDTVPGDADQLPDAIAHIARDPLDPAFDDSAFHDALRRRRTTLKRALLDQSLISGVGNIYADEALWRARLHYERPTATLTRPRTAELLGHVREVMSAALAVGGTSFDSLYVNVNGESGYFERSLDAYGREDEPCRRCGTPIRRRPWMNRSSYFCPRCQRPPRP